MAIAVDEHGFPCQATTRKYSLRMKEARDQKYMLDTTVFNHVLNEDISTALFAGHRLLVTGVQAGELKSTKAAQRRESLWDVFKDIAPISLLASSFAFGIEGAGWDQAYWNDGSGNFEKMLARLKELDGTKNRDLNQKRDILIAETAIKNEAVLVSGDSNLRKVVFEFGGHAISLNDFPLQNG